MTAPEIHAALRTATAALAGVRSSVTLHLPSEVAGEVAELLGTSLKPYDVVGVEEGAPARLYSSFQVIDDVSVSIITRVPVRIEETRHG